MLTHHPLWVCTWLKGVKGRLWQLARGESIMVQGCILFGQDGDQTWVFGAYTTRGCFSRSCTCLAITHPGFCSSYRDGYGGLGRWHNSCFHALFQGDYSLSQKENTCSLQDSPVLRRKYACFTAGLYYAAKMAPSHIVTIWMNLNVALHNDY